MATPNLIRAYDVLRYVMQQMALREQSGGACLAPNGGPEFNSGRYITAQGGLLARLREPQAGQSLYQPKPEDAGPGLTAPQNPNFRELARVPAAAQPQGATAPSDGTGDRSSSSYSPDTDAIPPISMPPAPDSWKAASAILQLIPEFAASLAGDDAENSGVADSPSALGGMTILESRRKGWPGKAREGDSPSMRRNRRKWRMDAQVRDMMGKAITSTSGADPGDPCDVRYSEEEKRCIDNWLKDARRICIAHAESRRDLCKRNGGKPDPNEKPEWSLELEQ